MKNAISKNYYLEDGALYDHRDTPRVALDYNSSDIKIEIYQDRVKTWFLEIAERLKKDNEAGFVILSVAIAYVEGNQQFREGRSSKNNSKSFFVKGIRRIFEKEDVPKKILEGYYEQVRCGLFHDGMTKKNVLISGEFSDPLRYSNGIIKINPHKFLDKIIGDFENYILALENDKHLRDNFIKRFSLEENHEIQS